MSSPAATVSLLDAPADPASVRDDCLRPITPARMRKAGGAGGERRSLTYRLAGPTALTSARNLRFMHELQRIASAFNDAGIPLMALKGAALNAVLHGQPHERPMADLDLLIKPEHVDQAFALLEELEGLRGETLVREDFFPQFHYEVEYSLGKIYPVKIDLHVRPFRPLRYSRTVPEDALWERAESVKVGTASVLAPCADDMLIHLAAHAAIHGFDRRKWAEDVYRWIRFQQGDIDWDRFLHTVEAWRLALPVRRAIQHVLRGLGDNAPSWVSDRLGRMGVNWRDRLALWQAPRDAAHPVCHVAVNALCTPGLPFVLSYLLAVVVPDRGHMGEWYCRRHPGWLCCAHLLRWTWPVVKLLRPLCTWFNKIETRESAIHGIGVFATRDLAEGEPIARYRGRSVDRRGMYVVRSEAKHGHVHGCELTGKLKFLNHSCRPNAMLSGFELVALKPVRIDEEITIDYGEGTCDCHRQAALAGEG